MTIQIVSVEWMNVEMGKKALENWKKRAEIEMERHPEKVVHVGKTEQEKKEA